MKKTIFGIIVGLLIGAGAMWLLSPKSETPAAKPADASASSDEAAPGTVKLESEMQEQADVKTAQPTAMEYKPSAKGFARVLDPASLIGELSDVASASAASAASASEYKRELILKLGGNASDRVVETAQAAMQHDDLQLQSAKARLVADWGKDIAARADLQDLAKNLLAQDASIVRIDMLAGETLPDAPRDIKVEPLMGGEAVSVDIIGTAPNADAQSQGVSFLGLIAKSPPVPGTQLVAWMTGSGPGQPGMSLPGSAIVRYEGDTFVYAQVDSEEFDRWRVKIGATLRDGSVFITNGVTAQDHIVVKGAAQILSEELKAATGGPD